MTDPVVDVHAHYVPPGLRAFAGDRGRQLGIEVISKGDAHAFRLGPSHVTRPLDARLWDLARRRDRMRTAGIDVQVLSVWTELTAYHLVGAAARTFARVCNDMLASDVAESGGSLLGMATVPLGEPAEAAAELRRSVVELGMVGVEVAADVAGPRLGDHALDEFWYTAEELRCPVLVHPIGGLAAWGLDRLLDARIGRPAETTIVMAQALTDGLLERHPELRLCVVHAGGFLPYQVGRLARAQQVAGAAWPGDVRSSLSQLYVDTVVGDPEVLRFVLDRLGPERLLLGTDDPFEGGDPDPLATLDVVPGLTSDERRAVSGANVRRLFSEIRR